MNKVVYYINFYFETGKTPLKFLQVVNDIQYQGSIKGYGVIYFNINHLQVKTKELTIVSMS